MKLWLGVLFLGLLLIACTPDTYCPYMQRAAQRDALQPSNFTNPNEIQVPTIEGPAGPIQDINCTNYGG